MADLLKQLESLGPGGSTLMDYAVYDACRLGFARAIFVVRPDIVERFAREILARYRRRFEVTTAIQRLDDLPGGFAVSPSRTKPWGTTHAVLAAREELDGPFVVLNADDFYGRAALAAVADALRNGSTEHAVVGYRLDATTSPVGGETKWPRGLTAARNACASNSPVAPMGAICTPARAAAAPVSCHRTCASTRTRPSRR